MRWCFLCLQLAAFWAALSLEFTNPFLVASGVVSAVAVSALVWRRELAITDWNPAVLLRALGVYLPWLLGQVLAANVRVIRVVWSPRLPIRPRLVEVPCSLRTTTGIAVYANSITLTPGTVTVEVDEGRLLVHALTEQDAADLLSGDMQARVADLEERVR